MTEIEVTRLASVMRVLRLPFAKELILCQREKK